jgi:hypothetical protein
MTETPNLLEEVVKIYREDSLFSVRANLLSIGRAVREDTRSNLKREQLLSCGIDKNEVYRWAFNKDADNAVIAYEIYKRAVNVMDEALFGNDELIEKVSEYEDERGFSFIHTADLIKTSVDHYGDTLTAKEIADGIFSGDGIYAGRAIVNEKGFGHLPKEFKKQAMRDDFFMTIIMENCKKTIPKKPQLGKDKKLRGDQEDWGKPRWNGYEEDKRKDEDGDDKK